MNEYGYTEQGRISNISMHEDHGPSVHVTVEGPGWDQGFGGLAFKDAAERVDFLLSVAKVFGENDYIKLVDHPCVALRPFSSGDIEGLRSVRTGRTFTITAWRERQGYPAPTPLQARLARREHEIAYLRRRLAEELASEDRIIGSYRPVIGEAP